MTVYLLMYDGGGSTTVREVYESEADARADADAANKHWREHDGSEPYSVEAFPLIPAETRLLADRPA